MLRRPLIVALGIVTFLPTCVVTAATRPAASTEAQTERYYESIRKDPNLLVAFLLEMPKGGDLHNHLSGAIYAETLIDWAAANGSCVDPATFLLSAAPCAVPQVEAKQAFGNPVLYLVSGFRWSFFENSDVGVGVSLGMTIMFMVLCLATVSWIFRTGYRLRS